MIDLRALPPLAALRAFAAYAGTGSVTAAGDTLNVSHAAISQQLRALETHLGVALFDRSARGLVLTEAGLRLADAVDSGFGAIVRAVTELTGADADRPLMVSTTSSFAAAWLLPQLADFRARNPGIDLMIDPTPEVKKLEPGGFDIALRYGAGNWPGVEAEQILHASTVVVAAPELQAVKRGLEFLGHLPWLQELGTSEATDFLQRHGLSRPDGGPGLTALPGNLLLEAVRSAQGVAVLTRAFVAEDLASGRLELLYEDEGCEGYFLVTRPGVLRPAARAFANWIRRQAKLHETGDVS